MKPRPKRSAAQATATRLSHIDSAGRASMVDIGSKPPQLRCAIADGRLTCLPGTVRALRANALPKGDVLAVAQVAGIQAAKRAAELIPLCHPLPLTQVEVKFRVLRNAIVVRCTVATIARTGVEMEALTGVTVAALTLYDMCKAVDRTMSIDRVRLVRKTKQ